METHRIAMKVRDHRVIVSFFSRASPLRDCSGSFEHANAALENLDY
jgi:hypothetical protein